MRGGRGGWRWQRIEPVSGRTATESDFIFLNFFLVQIDFFRQLAENVVNLFVDGQLAAPNLRLDLVLRLTSPLLSSGSGSDARPESRRIGLGLCTGGQAVVKLSDDSIKKIQTAPDIIAETRITFRFKTSCVI